MCNCIDEIEEELKTKLSAKNKEYADKTITKASLGNVALMFDSKQSVQLYSPVELEYDKQNKKGELVHKKEKMSMSYHYCPFCGKKYDED